MTNEPALIKLLSGEQLVSKLQDNGNGTFTLTDPLLIERVSGPIGNMLTVSDWLIFSKDNFITINADKIVAFKYGLEDNAIKRYNDFVNKVDEPIDHEEVEQAKDLIAAMYEQMQANTTIH
jgi:hypothetical protein